MSNKKFLTTILQDYMCTSQVTHPSTLALKIYVTKIHRPCLKNMLT